MKRLMFGFLLSLVLCSQIISQTLPGKEDQKFERKVIDSLTVNYLYYTQESANSSVDGERPNSVLYKDKNGFWGSISYRDGFIIGGEINGERNLQYMKYSSTFQAGKIISSGLADDPNKNSNQIYKINKEWHNLPFGSIKDRFEFDYNNWPSEDGAPYFDLDKNGLFSKTVDKPNPMGDEIIWFVSNALKLNESLPGDQYTYSNPTSLELQKMVYAFNDFNVLHDVVFVKYLFINKSNDTLNNFYFSHWNDPDIGNVIDDFACILPDMNLGIAFNGDSLDENQYGLTPPALGLLLLQGPKVKGNASDSALFIGKWQHGMKNLGVTSFNYFVAPFFEDPFVNYQLWDFNAIRGLNSLYGVPIINPISGTTTNFVLEGNPVEKTGWFAIDTLYKQYRQDDLRIYLSSGPFTMAPGDSQEVAVALIVGQGSDNLQSVADVIEKAKVVQYFYKNYDAYSTTETYTPPIPEYYSLSQNYPNPFNPSTKIDYDLPVDGLVSLDVFNVVGEKVTTLVNEFQHKGNHSTVFNASGLPSGIYFYSISALNYFKTRKMILLK